MSVAAATLRAVARRGVATVVFLPLAVLGPLASARATAATGHENAAAPSAPVATPDALARSRQVAISAPRPNAPASEQLPLPTVQRRLAFALEPEALLAAQPTQHPNRAGAPRLARTLTDLPNILVNDPTGQPPFTGNTQMEPSIAVHGDTLVCGFTDSGGLYGSGTLSGFAFSFDGGQHWTDGGSLPRAGTTPTEMVYGDPSLVTDGAGRWFYLSVYDVGNGSIPGKGDLGLVLQMGRFVGGSMQWTLPQLIAGGASGDALDSPHMAIDPARDRIYVAYANLSTAYAWGQIETVTLADAGTRVVYRTVVQPQTSDVNNAGARIAVGPEGEVYCAWESGLYTGNGQGPAQQKVAKSLDYGASFLTPVVAGTVVESWLSGPPGFNREQPFVEFPSLAVDCSSGPRRGSVYLAWHDGVPMSFDGTPTLVAEAPGNNDTPQTAQVLPDTSTQWQIDGSMTGSDYFDWYRFAGSEGEHVRMILQPTSFVQLAVRLRCGNGGSSLADTILAGSSRLTGEWVFFLFSLPTSGDYWVQIQRLHNGGSYTGFLRKATATTPATAIDHRDVVVVASPDGVSGWSPKVRVNDDSGFTDQAMPEVVVDGDGGAHVTWYDRRFDARCRALANLILASSFDGGTTFVANRRVTTESSFWQGTADAVPNFGDDFRPLAAGDRLFAVWADGRLGEPDVMIAPLRTGFEPAVPDSLRVFVGQPLGLEIEVRNTTPYDGARFQVQIDSPVAELPDSTLEVGPLAVGETGTAVYGPTVGNWIHNYGSLTLDVTVTSDHSAQVRTASVYVWNDQVAVRLADFAAQAGSDGVRLAWSASPDARFDVERAARPEGPYVRLTPAPLEPVAPGRFVYFDATAFAGARCAYRIVAIEPDGGRQVFGPWTVDAAAPRRVALLGAEPNPFNPTTELHFELPQPARVTLRLFDVRGRAVATLIEGAPRDAGTHAVFWDGRDGRGAVQPSGVYLAELQALGVRRSARLVLLR